MTSLQGKRIWLTGASSGIGEALAIECARRGAIVCLTARREDVLTKLLATITASGGSARSYAGDVTDPLRMKEIVSAIEKELGGIDILIANAGTHLFTEPERFSAAEYMGLMELNYGGVLNCIEAVLPAMIHRRSGALVAVASLAGIRGLPRAAAYGASKAALINFMESLRFHLAKYSLMVSVVNPGFVKTPLTDKNDFYMPFLIDSEKAARIICSGIEKNKREISFPFPFSWIVKGGKFLPHWLYEKIVNRLW